MLVAVYTHIYIYTYIYIYTLILLPFMLPRNIWFLVIFKKIVSITENLEKYHGVVRTSEKFVQFFSSEQNFFCDLKKYILKCLKWPKKYFLKWQENNFKK